MGFNLKEISGRFYLEIQTKAEIARAYLRDARDWRRLYLTVEKNMPTLLSVRAKNFVHLRLCFECCFKATAIALSKRPETAEGAYAAIRGCRHDLLKLLGACEQRSGKRFRIISPAFLEALRRINALDIGVRYDIDFKTQLKAQDVRGYYFDGPVTGVVIDEGFQNRAFTEAGSVYRRANSIYDRRFKKHTSCLMSERGLIEDYIRRLVLPKTTGTSLKYIPPA